MTDIEKRINWAAIGIMIAILGNMAGGIWYASQLSARVEVLEKRTSNLHTDRELLVRIDERILNMSKEISDMKRQLDSAR